MSSNFPVLLKVIMLVKDSRTFWRGSRFTDSFYTAQEAEADTWVGLKIHQQLIMISPSKISPLTCWWMCLTRNWQSSRVFNTFSFTTLLSVWLTCWRLWEKKKSGLDGHPRHHQMIQSLPNHVFTAVEMIIILVFSILDTYATTKHFTIKSMLM